MFDRRLDKSQNETQMIGFVRAATVDYPLELRLIDVIESSKVSGCRVKCSGNRYAQTGGSDRSVSGGAGNSQRQLIVTQSCVFNDACLVSSWHDQVLVVTDESDDESNGLAVVDCDRQSNIKLFILRILINQRYRRRTHR